MSNFQTVRENSITAEERFKNLIETNKRRSVNLNNLGQQAVIESKQVESLKELEDIDKTIDEKENKVKTLDKMKEACSTKRRKESKIALESRLMKEGKDFIMEMVLFEMVYEAYVADEDFKETKVQEMFEVFKQEMKVLESTCTIPTVKSKLVQAIESIVEGACRKSTKRIVKEAETEIERIEFNLNDEEEDELDEKLSELSKDQIEDMVKDKVVQVIKDEKEQNIKKAETIKDIDDKISEITDDNSDEELTVEESFNVNNLRNKRNSIRNSFEDSLFNSIMMETTNVLEHTAVKEGLSIEYKSTVMDTVLVESLLKYTVLEMAHTLGLYEIDRVAYKRLNENFIFTK